MRASPPAVAPTLALLASDRRAGRSDTAGRSAQRSPPTGGDPTTLNELYHGVNMGNPPPTLVAADPDPRAGHTRPSTPAPFPGNNYFQNGGNGNFTASLLHAVTPETTTGFLLPML